MSARSRRGHASDRTRNFKVFRVVAFGPDGRQLEPIEEKTKPLLRRAVDRAREAGATRIEVYRHTEYGAYDLLEVIEASPAGEGSR